MATFMNAFTMVFFAEMGDKSQIMAMSFAAKYPLRKVAMGIFFGIAVNHGIAVAVGFLLGKMLPVHLIGIIAGLLFLFFGLQAFKVEEEEDEEEAKVGFSVVQTIALAFFLGEFGDKTQLTATALASSTPWPLIVFAGTFSAMLATSALGIAVGSMLGKKMPEHLIKAVSGCVFLIFGTQKLFEQIPLLREPGIATLYGIALVVLATYAIRPLYAEWRTGRLSPMQRAAEHLKQMKAELKHLADGLCMGTEGPEGCGVCRGQGCIVGQTKLLIAALDHSKTPDTVVSAMEALETAVDRNFNVAMAKAGLELLGRYHTEHAEMYALYSQGIAPIEARLKRLSDGV